ncbi:MAG TPA: TetR/AcrR family transcriptional regulator [Candidatus Binatia bacterium]|nr:TetR/AcrR family transcriptional regulator [Candidatus Binatia bacterium]
MNVKAARPRVASAPATPTREAILDAAERLFSAHGVDGVAVRDLARELGLTPSSLYNHFPGKQALYEAVLERGLRPIVEMVARAWTGELRRDDIATNVNDLITHLGSHPHLGRLIQRAMLEETGSVQALLGRWMSPLYKEGVAIIRQAATSSGWDAEDVPHLTLGLFGLVFAYFVNGEALQRFGTWGGDAFAPPALDVQRRFLEKAIFRLLGPRPRVTEPKGSRSSHG